ncbi:SDR family oxidoreductase [Streptomyces sp. 11x1]|uniref:SDR family NAD(P)-dependent oxidoreductase n=1 Tax=Streptomyces sp. 11x1 TaxID=3038642 RepID=UPI00292EADFE|nr:SDR family oxidoreductase [Streptomyces sp. 11x1]WNZ11675.1 SDR family NAD(P)-dependent oxidoreductase [Streptomyces sp. 11x1]
MSLELKGKTALITGATAGIGRAVASTLAELGAAVVVHGRAAERGSSVVEEISAAGGTARFVAADLADPDAVHKLAEAAGPVDVLVNNAGVFQFGPMLEATAEAFDLHMAVNTRAPMLLVAALAPAMAKRGFGVVINITTGAVSTPVRGGGVYVSSKVALDYLTRVWADELGPSGVRVNAVAAGPTRTRGMQARGADLADTLGRTTTALGRAADPREIAEVVAFLASPRSGYVTGAVVEARGGAPAHS